MIILKKEKIVEKRLKETEELFQITFEQAAIGIAHVSPEGKFIRINQKFCNIVKYSKDEMLSIRFQQITYTDDLKEDLLNLERLLKGDIKIYIREKRYICKDKTIVWVNLTVSLVRDESNEPKFFIAIVQDITKRKTIENALAESESRYKNIIENTTDVIIVTGFDGKHTYVSPRYKELFGRTPEQIDKFLLDYLHPEDKVRMLKLYKESFQEKYAAAPDIEFEFRVQHQDGHYIWVSSVTKSYFNEEGKISGVITSLRDIRKRKETEKRLKESELRYKNIIENTTDIILVTDFNGKHIYVSPLYEKVTGWNPDKLTKLPIEFIHPEDRHIIMEKYVESFKNHYAAAPFSEIEFRILLKNGSYMWVSTITNNYFDENGQIIGLITSMRDISKRKEAEKKLIKNEKKYRHLFESSPYIIGLINENGTIIDCNSSVINFFSVPKEELIGKTIYEVFSEREENKNLILTFKNLIEVAYSEVQGGPMEFKLHRSSEDFAWLSLESSFIEIDDQLLIQFLMQDITEKKNIEENLKESEIKFRTIAEQSFMGISIIQDGIFKYFNNQVTEINGYSREDIQNWKPYEFLKTLHPDDRQIASEQVRKKESGDPDVLVNTKYRLIKKSGEIIWIENFSKTIIYKGQTADLVMSKDITEEVLADIKLTESEERYRLLFENMNSGFAYHEVIVNEDNKPIDYRYLEVNPAFERLTSIKREDLIGKRVTEAIPGTEDDPANWIEKFGNVGLTGIPLTVEDYSEAIDRWFEVSGYSPKRGFFAVTFNDITDRVKAMEKIKESELKFRNIFKANPSGMHLYDLNASGKLVFNGANPAAEKILKIDHQQKIGLTFEEAFPTLIGTDIPSKYKSVALNGGSLNWEYEYNINEQINRFYDIYTFQTAPGSIVASFLDITDRIEAEERLKEINKIKTDLLRRTSHELKTPLTSINGATDLLLTIYHKDFNEKTTKFLEIIQNGSQRLENLIKDLLNVSRLQTQIVVIHKRMEDIVKLMRNSIKEVEVFAMAREIEISFNQVESVIIMVDKNKILQVFANILMNAIKYTPPSGKISVMLEVQSNVIDFLIKDTGIGFTKEEKGGLFKQFGKIERFGHGFELNTEGSGLGLYISKELVELHSGTLSVESEGRNKGSTFIIRLPKL